MSNLFTPDELQVLMRKYSDQLFVPPLPSVDEMVAEFCRQHDVDVTPAGSRLGPSPISNAVMGAFGPGYVAVNTHLTQQQKAAALQEWTSWKQWTLSHPDYPAFKKLVAERRQRRKDEVDTFIRDNHEFLREELVDMQEHDRLEKRNATIPLIIVLPLVAAVAGAYLWISHTNKPADSPLNDQPQSLIPGTTSSPSELENFAFTGDYPERDNAILNDAEMEATAAAEQARRQQLEKNRMDHEATKANIKRLQDEQKTMQIEHQNRIEKIFQDGEERRKLINAGHPDPLSVIPPIPSSQDSAAE